MIGNSTISIGINMFLRDQFSAPSRRITGASNMMKQSLRALRAESDNLRWTRNINTGLAVVGVGATLAMAKAIKTGADFAFMMERVKAVTGASAREMTNLSYIAKKLGRDTMYYGKDIAETMNTLSLAGVNTKELPNVTKASVYLAGASQTRLEGEGGAADTMISIMRMFSADESSAMRVADVLTNAANKSNITLTNLAESIKYTGTTAGLLNLSLEETAALAMVIGNAGLKGSMGGVSIENMLRYMTKAISNPTKNQRTSLQAIGLSGKEFMDQNGNLNPIGDMMSTLKSALDKTFGQGAQNTVYKQGILANLFNVRGSRAAGLAMKLVDDYNKFLNDLNNNSTGTAERITKQMMETLKGYGDRIKSNVESIAITFTTAITPVLIPLAKIIEGILGGINKILELPFVGPFLSVMIGKVIIVKTLTWAWRAATAGVMLIMNSLRGTVVTTGATTVSTYQAMTRAVLGFTAAQRASGASMMSAGILATVASRRGARFGGLIATGAIAGAAFRSARTGRYVSAAVAARYASRMSTGTLIGQGLRGGIARSGGLGLLRLLGLTTPMGLMFNLLLFLPMIISALRSNTDATKENNSQTHNNSAALERETTRRINLDNPNRTIFNENEAIIRAMEVKFGTLDQIAQRMGIAPQNQKPEVHLYVDGEKKTQKVIDKREKQIISDSIGVMGY